MTSGSSNVFVPGKLYLPRAGIVNMMKYTKSYDPDIEYDDSEKIRWDQKSAVMYIQPLDKGNGYLHLMLYQECLVIFHGSNIGPMV